MPFPKYKYMNADYSYIYAKRGEYCRKIREEISDPKLVKERNYKARQAYKRMNWSKHLEAQKADTYLAMGNKCCQCKFADKRCLQIDHVNGNGKIDKTRTSNRLQYLKHVKQSFLNKENKYQLLCANCNWIKRHTNKELPPRKDNSIMPVKLKPQTPPNNQNSQKQSNLINPLHTASSQ